jgi:hypothetical protein
MIIILLVPTYYDGGGKKKQKYIFVPHPQTASFGVKYVGQKRQKKRRKVSVESALKVSFQTI